MPDALIKELKRRMEGALDALKREFGGLRTGRAATSLLEPIIADLSRLKPRRLKEACAVVGAERIRTRQVARTRERRE